MRNPPLGPIIMDMHNPRSTETQLNNLIEFRQALYDYGFTKRRDVQFELLDALLSSEPVRSFPDLSRAPVFRRSWASVYAALEDGRIDSDWLLRRLVQQLPATGLVLALDGSAWPRPQAPTLPDRQYVYSPTPAVDGGSIVVGLPYSLLSWVPELATSWALPLEVTRITSQDDALAVGIAQIQHFCRIRAEQPANGLDVVVADGTYGNPCFLQALRNEPVGVLVRLRKDRVLYRRPGPYSGKGRPAVHGPRFVFKDPSTWQAPDEQVELSAPPWGHVRIRAWRDLHARKAVEVPLTVLLVEVHQEREQPPPPLWLGWQGPHQPLEACWRAYARRWSIEPSIRLRKQQLAWTTPHVRTLEAADRWSVLVSLAQWQLSLARTVVADRPLPWQRLQPQLTPGRVQRGMGALFARIGTPAAPPKRRGTAPGWPKGRARCQPERHAVVKKGPAPPKKRKKRRPPARKAA